MNPQSEPFYLLLEDPQNNRILHQEYFSLSLKKMKEPTVIEFAVPMFPPVPDYYTLRVVSDRWLGSDNEIQFYLNQLIMSKDQVSTTKLLDLTPLPVTALHNNKYVSFRSCYTN